MQDNLAHTLRKLAANLRQQQKLVRYAKLQKTAAVVTALTGLEILRRKVFSYDG